MKFVFKFLVFMVTIQRALTNNSYPTIDDYEDSSTPNASSGSTGCYGVHGCITLDGQLHSASRHQYHDLHHPLHHRPQVLKAEFLLFTRDNPDGPQMINATVEAIRFSNFRRGLPLKIIIPGHWSHSDLDWFSKLTKEILRAEDVNVIVVDWRQGPFTTYGQSIVNGRHVGALVASFINFLRDSFSFQPKMVHVIGQSLGAQIASFVGNGVEKLGRISGLDPAQLAFENAHPIMHLDPSDALFVDVIHTDTAPYIQGYGYGPPCGHVDFYPNGGKRQPECRKPLMQKIRDNIDDLQRLSLVYLACQHNQVIDLFIESLRLDSCPFTAVQCTSYSDFSKGRCFDCGTNGKNCAPLGYYSDQWFNKFGYKLKLPVKMYLKTGTDRPLCRFHHRVTFKTTYNQERNGGVGRFAFKFTGADGTTSRMFLHEWNIKFQLASSYMFVIVSKSAEFIRQGELEWIDSSRQRLLPRLRNRSAIDISSMEIEGLEVNYRCTYDVNAAFSIRDSVKAVTATKCENVPEEEINFPHYPIASSKEQNIATSSSNDLLQGLKGLFPLFKKREDAASFFLDPVIEGTLTNPS